MCEGLGPRRLRALGYYLNGCPFGELAGLSGRVVLEQSGLREAVDERLTSAGPLPGASPQCETGRWVGERRDTPWPCAVYGGKRGSVEKFKMRSRESKRILATNYWSEVEQ